MEKIKIFKKWRDCFEKCIESKNSCFKNLKKKILSVLLSDPSCTGISEVTVVKV